MASTGVCSMMASLTRHFLSSAKSTIAGNSDALSSWTPTTPLTACKPEMMLSRTLRFTKKKQQFVYLLAGRQAGKEGERETGSQTIRSLPVFLLWCPRGQASQAYFESTRVPTLQFPLSSGPDSRMRTGLPPEPPNLAFRFKNTISHRGTSSFPRTYRTPQRARF